MDNKRLLQPMPEGVFWELTLWYGSTQGQLWLAPQ